MIVPRQKKRTTQNVTVIPTPNSPLSSLPNNEDNVTEHETALTNAPQPHTSPSDWRASSPSSKTRPPYSPSSSSTTNHLQHMLREVEEEWNEMSRRMSRVQTTSNMSPLTLLSLPESKSPTSSNEPSSLHFQHENIVVTYHTIDNSISFQVEHQFQSFERHLMEREIFETEVFKQQIREQSEGSAGDELGERVPLQTVRDIYNLILERKSELQILNISSTPARQPPASPSRAAQIFRHNSSQHLLATQGSSSSLLEQNFHHIDKIVLKIFSDWYIECIQSLESDLEKRIRIAETWILNTGKQFSHAFFEDMKMVGSEVKKLKSEVNDNLVSQISSLQEEIQHSVQSWNLQQNVMSNEQNEKFSMFQGAIDNMRNNLSEQINMSVSKTKDGIDADITSLHTVIDTFTEKLKEVTRQSTMQYTKLSKKVDSSQKEIANRCDSMSEKQDTWTQQATENTHRIASISSELTAQSELLQNHIYQSQEQIQSLQQENRELRTEMNRLGTLVDKLTEALSMTHKKLQLIESEGSRYKSKLKKIAQKLPALEYTPATFGFYEARKHPALHISACNRKVSFGGELDQHAHVKLASGISPSKKRGSRADAASMRWISCLGDAVWASGSYSFTIRCTNGDSNWRVGLIHPDSARVDSAVGSVPQSVALQVSNHTVYVCFGESEDKLDLDFPVRDGMDEVTVNIDLDKRTLAIAVNGCAPQTVSTAICGPVSPCVSMQVPVTGSSIPMSKWKRSLTIVNCQRQTTGTAVDSTKEYAEQD